MKRIFCCLVGLFMAVCPSFGIEKDAKIMNFGLNAPQKKVVKTPFIDSMLGKYDNKIDIVFSDIDGTLLVPDPTAPKGQVPETVKVTAARLKSAHIPMFLATGRSYGEASAIAKGMGLQNPYIIALHGSEIFNPKGELIYKNVIPKDDAVNIVDEIKEFVKKNHFESKVYFFVDGKPFAFESYEIPYMWEKFTIVKSLDDFASFTPAKICVFDKDGDVLREIQAFIKKKNPDYRVDISTSFFCEVTTNTASKGNAVKKVAELSGINLKNAVVFGDAENDLSMFETVKEGGGIAVAVSNSMPVLKENASYVTSSVYEGGVNHAVKIILQNNALLEQKNKEMLKK